MLIEHSVCHEPVSVLFNVYIYIYIYIKYFAEPTNGTPRGDILKRPFFSTVKMIYMYK